MNYYLFCIVFHVTPLLILLLNTALLIKMFSTFCLIKRFFPYSLLVTCRCLQLIVGLLDDNWRCLWYNYLFIPSNQLGKASGWLSTSTCYQSLASRHIATVSMCIAQNRLFSRFNDFVAQFLFVLDAANSIYVVFT